ncbi:sensory neuron membrane protein 1-like [Phymastichus coffea]|uniref:sensory neuron membrane protein 1-like n=1 Tax=Phymastichus coffea TaxID=108790 RepID=UPI00273B2F2D|nr:sensory neuron membrane protein 1-like [Phymastichus coffea]
MPNELMAQVKAKYHNFIDTVKYIFGKDGLSARHRKIGINGVSSIIFSIVFLTVIFPIILESLIQKHSALKKGWFMRKMWRKSTYEFHVYLFNVTNPEEIAKGDKPTLKEVGPYVYDVWQEKTNIEDHETDDTLTYSVKNTFFFNDEKSRCLSDDDELTLGHFVSLGIPNYFLITKPHLIPVTTKVVDGIVNNPQSVFVRAKVKDYLFDGFAVDCSGIDDFLAKSACNDIKENYVKYQTIKASDDVYKYSMWGYLNLTDTYSGKTRIRRGIRNIMEVGDLIEFNDMKNMSVWDDDKCDAFIGTDGTLFHPFINKRKNIYVTNTFFCRRLTYSYDSEVQFAGLKLFRYTTSLGTNSQTNPEDKCFCLAPDRCHKNGVFEVWKCLSNAYVASNPHFYAADPYFINSVKGLKPVKEKHLTTIDFDPLTGWPIRTQFRMQYNFALTKLSKYRLMANFPEAMLPVGWIDQVTILPSDFVKKIKYLHVIIKLSRIFSGLIILVGFILCCYTVFHEYRLYKIRKAQRANMRKIISKWRTLAAKQDKKTMGISLRTIKTLKIMQQAQVPARIS